MKYLKMLSLLLFALVVAAPELSAETVKLEAVKDVGLSSFTGNPPEVDFSMSATPKIKLKGNEEFCLFDFDVSKLKGKKISGAVLFIKHVGGAESGLNAGSDLRWLSVSSVSHEWTEGKQAKEYAKDEEGFGATFNESSYSKANWGWPGSKVIDVIMGNGNSCRTEGVLDPAEGEGWLKMVLDPKLVQMMIARATHGLCLLEGTTDVKSNQYICSREGGSPVYLSVTVDGADASVPSKPEAVKITAAPELAGVSEGALMVSLNVAPGTLALNVKLDGTAVERWQIPYPSKNGGVMTFALRDLAPNKDVKVEISAVNSEGNTSEFAAVTGKTSPALSVPELPGRVFNPRGGEPKALGDAVVWALPEVTKIHPVTGKILQEKLSDDFRMKNPVWDGADGTIRLAAARAEIVSFQLVFEGKVKDCQIIVSSLVGPEKKEIAGTNVKLWRNWYVGGQAEYAIPVKGGVECPAVDNAVKDQKLQTVTVDYHIPKESAAGEYLGSVALIDNGKKLILPLKVKVYDVVIPDDLNFNPELNSYSPVTKEFYKLAHYNRCTVNALPYSQSGRTNTTVPAVRKDGTIGRWSEYDTAFGSLLDGSYFRDNPRSGVPLATFYLPFNEGWPLNYKEYFQPGCPFKGLSDYKKRLPFNIKAKPIEEAISAEYQKLYTDSVRDFYLHAKEKGWTKTIFECYLNNKPDGGSTAWTLDEPRQTLDWAALNFWAGLFKKGINDPLVYTSEWQKSLFEKGLSGIQRESPNFLFRGDISRPQYQGSFSDGLFTIMYANNDQFSYPRLMQGHRSRMPTVLYTYGSCNTVDRSNWDSVAWCLQAFVNYCDGVLPWQSIGTERSLKKADQNGLLLLSPVHNTVVASLRVHALRRGAQDCELLRLLQLKKGWGRDSIALLIDKKIKLKSEFKQEKADDAAAVVFTGLNSEAFLDLKEGVLRLLTE